MYIDGLSNKRDIANLIMTKKYFCYDYSLFSANLSIRFSDEKINVQYSTKR